MIFTEAQRWELIGINSYTNGCTVEYPSIYTRVTAFVSFIQTNINDTSLKLVDPICACQCPQRFVQEYSHARVNSTEECIIMCERVALYGCDSLHTDECNSTNCPDSVSSFHSTDSIYEGIYIRLKGQICSGFFKNEKMHGKGTCQFANEDNYTGYWMDGKRTGYGVFTWSYGDRYEGDFYNDSRAGYGVHYSHDGGRYEGYFKDDQTHGIGTYYYSNGDNYTGDWANNHRSGYGIFISSNGDRYEGQFQNDSKHGSGTMYFSTRDNYTGDWLDDKRTGYGVFTWSSGDRYKKHCSVISRHHR